MAKQKVIHNTERERKAMQYLPEGHNLDVDRSYTAQTVVTDINEWKNKTNRVDLRGFDTKDAKEPSPRKLIKKLGIGYVESESDRFMRDNQESKRLLERYKTRIVDFQTFKKAVKEAWSKDMSLRNLLEEMKEKDYEALFNTGEMQSWIKENVEVTGIQLLMRRMNVGEGRATRVWSKLPQSSKLKILKQGRLKPIGKRSKDVLSTTKGIQREAQRLIEQRARGGSLYSRTRPQRWSELQSRYIINNENLPLTRLLERYNQLFPQSRRTISSLRNKRYRLRNL